MKKIIVHDGKAHQDDFLASCVCLYKLKPCELYREKFQEKHLTDSDCWVLDQGRRFQPKLHNFDHHQIEQEICSFTQVLDYFYKNNYRQNIPQLRCIEILDSYGPDKAANFLGISREAFDLTQSLIASSIINIFSNISGKVSGSILDIMEEIGKDICNKIEESDELLKILENSIYFQFNNINILDVTKCKTDRYDKLPTELYCKINNLNPIVILTIDSRQGGFRMVSINTNCIKFKNNPLSYFTHNSGFLTNFKNYEDYKTILENYI